MIAAWIGGLCMLAVSILYILLAAGLPYGELAMGGKYRIMPKRMRAACAVSVLIQWFTILLLLHVGDVITIDAFSSFAVPICYVFAVYLLFNTVINALSGSRKEKLVMTPLSLATAICFFVTAWNS